MSSNNFVNLQVPNNMVDDLRRYMQTMNMDCAETQEGLNMEVETTSEKGQYEVEKVINHKIVDGKWMFEVVWKDNKLNDWVDDEDCSCEDLISEYLKDKEVKTAYLFCRVSTKEQAKSTNLSLEAQESELRSMLEQRFPGLFKRVRVYSISQSAYKNIPSVLVRIGSTALQGDGIFVWRVDRLSRNIVKYMGWCEELNERGVMLYSYQEDLTYSSKKLEFIQAIVNAQKEAVILGERVKLSFRRKRARGDTHIGSLAFGKMYKRVLNEDGTTKNMVVVDNPHEQMIIDKIRAKRMKPAELARHLNDLGLFKRNRKWSEAMVIRIKKI